MLVRIVLSIPLLWDVVLKQSSLDLCAQWIGLLSIPLLWDVVLKHELAWSTSTLLAYLSIPLLWDVVLKPIAILKKFRYRPKLFQFPFYGMLFWNWIFAKLCQRLYYRFQFPFYGMLFWNKNITLSYTKFVALSIPLLWDVVLKRLGFDGGSSKTTHPFNSPFMGCCFETSTKASSKPSLRHFLSIPLLWDVVLKLQCTGILLMLPHAPFNSPFMGCCFETQDPLPYQQGRV